MLLMYLTHAQILYRTTWAHTMVAPKGGFDMSKSLCRADSF